MAAPKQDVAPKGGFPKIDYKRNIPKARFGGPSLYLMAAVGMGLGLVRLCTKNKEERCSKFMRLHDEFIICHSV